MSSSRVRFVVLPALGLLALFVLGGCTPHGSQPAAGPEPTPGTTAPLESRITPEMLPVTPAQALPTKNKPRKPRASVK